MMSRKTEPHLPDSVKGDCIDCNGMGFTGMYRDHCNYCKGTGRRQMNNAGAKAAINQQDDENATR